MKSSTIWIIVLVVLLVIALALPGILGYPRFGWRGGMMGGHSFLFPFGFMGMGLMMLWPVALTVILVLAIVAIVSSLTRSNREVHQQAPLPTLTCPNCSKPVQADWNNCAYCGTSLSHS